MDFWNQAKAHTVSMTEHIVEPFCLDSRLRDSCFLLTDWPLSQVLLKNNAEYPWLILVPRRLNISELPQLTPADQWQLMIEINHLCEVVQNVFNPDKINMGALGNIVPQFHYHVVARFQQDALWPQGVWQQGLIDTPYSNPEKLIETLKSALMFDKQA